MTVKSQRKKNEQIVAYRILLGKEFPRVKTKVAKKKTKSHFNLKLLPRTVMIKWSKNSIREEGSEIAQMNDDANRFMCSFYSRTSE